MLELSSKTNLLEENDYRYSLQDVKDPVLYRDVYNYDEVPKVAFNHRRVPTSMPADIWITDTSFRDGQQSMNPYTPEQIEHLFKLLSKLGGPYGLIRQTEFFIYSKRDREAIERLPRAVPDHQPQRRVLPSGQREAIVLLQGKFRAGQLCRHRVLIALLDDLPPGDILNASQRVLKLPLGVLHVLRALQYICCKV